MYGRNPYQHFPHYQNQYTHPYHYQNPNYYPYGHYGTGQTAPNFNQPQPHLQWPNSQGQQSTHQQPLGPTGMFTGPDGSFDFNKAISSFDQIMKTANEVSPIMKQIGSIFMPKK